MEGVGGVPVAGDGVKVKVYLVPVRHGPRLHENLSTMDDHAPRIAKNDGVLPDPYVSGGDPAAPHRTGRMKGMKPDHPQSLEHTH